MQSQLLLGHSYSYEAKWQSGSKYIIRQSRMLQRIAGLNWHERKRLDLATVKLIN